MTRVAVDLFSGTGGATAAFRTAPGWKVVAVELDPIAGRPPDVVADVRALPLRGPVDFLWASPPCTEFSDANPRVDHKSKTPDLSLVVATLQAVATLRPRFWIMENVRGAIPFLGTPAQKIGPWCLWGYFPLVRPSLEEFLEDQLHRKTTARSPRKRAAIPGGLSRAVLRTVEKHWDAVSILDLQPFRRHRQRRWENPHGRTGQLPLPLEAPQ